MKPLFARHPSDYFAQVRIVKNPITLTCLSEQSLLE